MEKIVVRSALRGSLRSCSGRKILVHVSFAPLRLFLWSLLGSLWLFCCCIGLNVDIFPPCALAHVDSSGKKIAE